LVVSKTRFILAEQYQTITMKKVQTPAKAPAQVQTQSEAQAAIEKLVSDKRLNAQSNTYQSVMLAIEYPNKNIPCSKVMIPGLPPASWAQGVDAACFMAGIPFDLMTDKNGNTFVKIIL
jgi:hypothetical protein